MKASNIDNFVNLVCNNIKYSPIKKDLKEELYEHIIEEKNKYIENGINDEEAEIKAINNMGEPEEISKEFNKIYKKNLDWKILLIFIVLMLINILLIITIANDNEKDSQYLIRNVLYIVVGGILSFIVYKIDYKKIAKFSLRDRNSWNIMYNN